MYKRQSKKTWLLCVDTATARSVVHVSHYTPTSKDGRVIYELELVGDNIVADRLSPPITLNYSYSINKQYRNDVMTNIIEDLYID